MQLVALSVAHPGRGWTAVAVGREGKGAVRSEQGPLRILICGSLYLAGHVLALQDGVTTQTN